MLFRFDRQHGAGQHAENDGNDPRGHQKDSQKLDFRGALWRRPPSETLKISAAGLIARMWLAGRGIAEIIDIYYILNH